MSDNVPNQSGNRIIVKLLAIVFGMFGFGFALVPLYDVICDITGLNGKTGDRYEVTETLEVDTERWITVQFTTSNNADMPWEFKPREAVVKVRPGEINEAYFVATNTTGQRMSAQAVPSLSPFSATEYFNKTECFCFNQQTLEAGESIDMPLRFFVAKDIPNRLSKLTLSYTLFNLPQVAAN